MKNHDSNDEALKSFLRKHGTFETRRPINEWPLIAERIEQDTSRWRIWLPRLALGTTATAALVALALFVRQSPNETPPLAPTTDLAELRDFIDDSALYDREEESPLMGREVIAWLEQE